MVENFYYDMIIQHEYARYNNELVLSINGLEKFGSDSDLIIRYSLFSSFETLRTICPSFEILRAKLRVLKFEGLNCFSHHTLMTYLVLHLL